MNLRNKLLTIKTFKLVIIHIWYFRKSFRFIKYIYIYIKWRIISFYGYFVPFKTICILFHMIFLVVVLFSISYNYLILVSLFVLLQLGLERYPWTCCTLILLLLLCTSFTFKLLYKNIWSRSWIWEVSNSEARLFDFVSLIASYDQPARNLSCPSVFWEVLKTILAHSLLCSNFKGNQSSWLLFLF